MKTIFDEATLDELVSRIARVSNESKAEWGKMNVYEMVKHCAQWEEMILGKQKYKRAFLGRLFGKIALKDLLKDDNPMKRNLPTLPEFKIRGTGNLAAEKQKWIALIKEHANCQQLDFSHPFFGELTREQTGYLAYKHTDHHLTQFNC